MTPEQLNQFNDMLDRLKKLERVENVSFIENIKRRLDVAGDIRSEISSTKLNDLADVDTSGVGSGQVIKYVGGTQTWENANDNVGS